MVFVCKTSKITIYFKFLVLLKRTSLVVFYNSKIIALAAIFLQYFGLGYRKSILNTLYNINKSLNICCNSYSENKRSKYPFLLNCFTVTENDERGTSLLFTKVVLLILEISQVFKYLSFIINLKTVKIKFKTL